jgi:hypothetical protein
MSYSRDNGTVGASSAPLAAPSSGGAFGRTVPSYRLLRAEDVREGSCRDRGVYGAVPRDDRLIVHQSEPKDADRGRCGIRGSPARRRDLDHVVAPPPGPGRRQHRRVGCPRQPSDVGRDLEFRVGVVRSRATYTFVVAERTGSDGHPAKPVDLPLLLSPDAAKLKAALDVLLAERHNTARGIPGRIQRWPNQP